ncbi:hypothetical protein AC96_3193 [Escherichia coli 2-156-04_S4_C2]|nr:hypothetical protein AC96_3193 [Escherichia coli 2-156-04_S4_C2]
MPCFIDTDLCQGATRLAPSTAIKQMPDGGSTSSGAKQKK